MALLTDVYALVGDKTYLLESNRHRPESQEWTID